jgi:mRNA interferase MazF
MHDKIKRGNILLCNLDPSIGSEIKKARPFVVVSPDELNDNLDTVIIAPLTSGGYKYLFRIPCVHNGIKGHIVLDQIRSIDKLRLVKYEGKLTADTLNLALNTLAEMFYI